MIRLQASITLFFQASTWSSFILNIQPVINEHQSVLDESLLITPATPYVASIQPGTGNRMLRFDAGPGPLSIRHQCVVDIRHHLSDPASLPETSPARLPDAVLRYVLPSRYCESDVLMPFALSQFGHLLPGYSRALAVSNWVQQHIRFVSGSSLGTTSASQTFLRREGVCRDFSHLMIALCRALNLPARFVTGIDYGADPALGPTDFHAFVEVFLDGRWYLFDPTGICPVNGLMRIGTGMDAADSSFAMLFGQVRTAAPVITIEAIDAPDQGIERPARTYLAVSTSASD